MKWGDNMGTMNEAVKEYVPNQRMEEWIVGWIEGYAEGKIETIRNMIKDHMPLEIVLKCAGIDREIYDKYANG